MPPRQAQGGCTTRYLWIPVLMAAAVFACTEEEAAPADESTAATTTPASAVAAEETPAPTPSPSPVPAAPSQYALGETATTPNANTVVVYSYEAGISGGIFDPDPGNVWASIDVEGCAAAGVQGEVSLNPFDFELQMPDNTRMDADIGVREPALNATTLLPGDCVRGFVSYQVPAGVTPASVIFQTFDADFNTVIIKWAVQ